MMIGRGAGLGGGRTARIAVQLQFSAVRLQGSAAVMGGDEPHYDRWFAVVVARGSTAQRCPATLGLGARTGVQG